MISNIQEIKSRKGPVIAIAAEGDGKIKEMADEIIEVPRTLEYLYPILTLLALLLGRHQKLSLTEGVEAIKALSALPEQVRKALSQDNHIQAVAEKYYRCSNWLFLGRKYQYPIALEGALKLKEISYIHAEGYAAGEMKQ